MTRIELPWPPTVNTYWRHVGPKVLVSDGGRRYRRTVADLVLEARCSRAISLGPLQGRLRVSIDVHVPDRRPRDVDNMLKAPLDALTKAGLWVDDSQIDDLRIVRRGIVHGGLIVVAVEQIEQLEAA
jgi:crossover junction endodeoxyribonuclease RusA